MSEAFEQWWSEHASPERQKMLWRSRETAWIAWQAALAHAAGICRGSKDSYEKLCGVGGEHWDGFVGAAEGNARAIEKEIEK